MRYSKSYIALNLIGIIFSTVPALVATLLYFPLWRERGSGYVLSGMALVLVVLASVPLLRLVKKRLRSPSAPLMWLIIFLFFLAMSRIADELTVISFFGFIGNLAGAVCFRFAKARLRREAD